MDQLFSKKHNEPPAKIGLDSELKSSSSSLEGVKNLQDFASQQTSQLLELVQNIDTDQQEKISQILAKISPSAMDSHMAREEIKVLAQLKDLQKRALAVVSGFKEKINTLFDDKQPDNKNIQEDFWYQNSSNHLEREKELSTPMIAEARKRRDLILEKRGALEMSREDFQIYFSSKEFPIITELSQGNTGDCYAVSAIHALSRSPHFEMICRSSMKRLADGSWRVRMPLMSKDAEVITITPEEISPQKNKEFLKRKEGKGFDLRHELRPLKGKEGFQVLEAAFIKQKFGVVDRLAAEGGWGADVLLALGGDNFIDSRVGDVARYSKEDEVWIYKGLDHAHADGLAYVDHFLNHFDPEFYIATTSTRHNLRKSNNLNSALFQMTGLYKGKGTLKTFVPGHEYSVAGVDRERKIVTVVNPWDTTKPIELTFDQFKGTFSSLGMVRINSYELLKNTEYFEKSL